MSKKLFYSDPLASAYMAREFGVELYSNHTDEQMDEYDISEPQRAFNWFDSTICDGWMYDVEMVRDAIRFIEESSDKIYVYPDSYHIFEPQVEDWGKTNSGYWCVYDECKDWFTAGYGITRLDDSEEIKIIQRNNKPFFWPESEEV